MAERDGVQMRDKSGACQRAVTGLYPDNIAPVMIATDFVRHTRTISSFAHLTSLCDTRPLRPWRGE